MRKCHLARTAISVYYTVTFFVLALSSAPVVSAGTELTAGIFRLVQKFYPDKVYWMEQKDLSLNEALSYIDPHASWIPADQPQPNELSDDSVVIGADLLRKDSSWWIVPYQGGTLFDRGLIDRSRLLAIDGVDIQNQNKEQLLSRIRGGIHTLTCLSVEIGSVPRTECIQRRPVQPPSVERIFTEKGQKPRIRIRNFRSHQTRIELQQAITAMQKLGLPIRIDLRESSGGDLFEALDCAALFVDGGTPIVEFRAIHGEDKVITAPSSFPMITAPIDILIGPDTSSAAEIFAGILRIHAGARLIGERTYGKCTSQKRFSLADGSSLWLTNLVVYFTDGRTCEGHGLETRYQCKGSLSSEITETCLLQMPSSERKISIAALYSFSSCFF
ncbi:MAG: hypothetical protein KDI54_19150 [Gammaproteobacteria bacterium]|nr:hypothetical protein [Gammaproteobacteria bacterium]